MDSVSHRFLILVPMGLLSVPMAALGFGSSSAGVMM